MSNLLFDELPTTVEIDGEDIPIQTDWRASIRTMMAFEDADLTYQEKTLIMLGNVFGNIPTNGDAALEKAIWFLNAGKVETDENQPNEKRVFSFSNDANYIFAAFHQTHGIDLEQTQMHWWKFLALFMDLGSETTFCQLTAFRKRYFSGKLSKEERKTAQDLKRAGLLDVPQGETIPIEKRDVIEQFEREIAELQERKKKEKENAQKEKEKPMG